MPHLYSVKWMLQRVVQKLQEGSLADLDDTDNPLSGTLLIEDLNAAYSQLTRIGQQFGYPALLQYLNGTANATTGIFDVKWHPQRGRIMGLKRRRDANDTAPGINEGAMHFAQYMTQKQGMTQPDKPQWETTAQRQIIVKTSQHAYWRLWLLRQPARLISGTVTSWDSDNSQLTVSATLDYSQSLLAFPNAYVDELILVGERILRITAWSPSTRKFTLAVVDESSLFDTAPTSGTEWSLLPWFNLDYCELLVLMTVMAQTRFPQSGDFALQYAELRKDFDDEMAQFDQATQLQTTLDENTSGVIMGALEGTEGGILY